jgi:hypothetical protein
MGRRDEKASVKGTGVRVLYFADQFIVFYAFVIEL